MRDRTLSILSATQPDAANLAAPHRECLAGQVDMVSTLKADSARSDARRVFD